MLKIQEHLPCSYGGMRVGSIFLSTHLPSATGILDEGLTFAMDTGKLFTI